MIAIKADLSEDLKSIELHTFSDWHIGDKFCDIVDIRKQIERVRNTDNAFVILNGDLLNNATKTSVSDCYSEQIPPMKQIEMVTELLMPIKDKILMICNGNHEARTFRTDGIDLTTIIANNLGKLPVYAREGGVLFLRFGRTCKTKTNGIGKRKVCYSIMCTHGSGGGGRKEGAKAIRLADMACIADTDIYIHSHTHLPLVMKQSFFRVDATNSSVSQVEKLFVNTSAKLGYGGYGQTYEFKPSSIASPVIYLNGSKKEFFATM